MPFFVGNRGLQTLMLSLRVFYSAAFFLKLFFVVVELLFVSLSFFLYFFLFIITFF